MAHNPISNQQLNTLAKEHDIKIELFNGWLVTANDGNVYRVKKFDELNALVKNLARDELCDVG